MAITSELLGKIGGADVEVIPVSVEVHNGDALILYIGDVPPGRTHWVFVVGTMDPRSSSSQKLPDVWIGDTPGRFPGYGGVAAEVKTGYHITMNRNHSSTIPDRFDGHIYIVKG